MSSFADFLNQLAAQRAQTNAARQTEADRPLPVVIHGPIKGNSEAAARAQAQTRGPTGSKGVEDEAEYVLNNGPDAATFRRPFSEAIAVMGMQPRLMQERYAEQDNAQLQDRERAMHQARGTLGFYKPSDVVLESVGPRIDDTQAVLQGFKPHPYRTAPEHGSSMHLQHIDPASDRADLVEGYGPNAPPMPHIDPMGVGLDDLVQNKGYDGLFRGLDPSVMAGVLGAQLDAHRKLKMGKWDPTVASGGSF